MPQSCSHPSGPWFHGHVKHWIGGGCIAIAGIQLPDLRELNYERDVFEQRRLCSVTANDQQNGIEFLDLAAWIPVRVSTTPHPMSRSNKAPDDLACDRMNGAAVLLYRAMV